MKNLCLLRHAKSSWKQRDLPDHDRPLKGRGRRDSRNVGDALALQFDAIYTSTAVRAQSTINIVMERASIDEELLVSTEALYTFDARRVLSFVRDLSDSFSTVLIVGHNPAFTDLCNDLSDAGLENLPTGGFAKISCDVDHWRSVTDGCAELVSLVTPKMLRVRKSDPDSDWYR
ncbi:MAG: histidine phosphatase family protein [Gammaproteobacteria bacterium]